MPQSEKRPIPKHLGGVGPQMLPEFQEVLPGQLSPGADDSTSFHETPQHLDLSLTSSPLSEHPHAHSSTAGHFPFEHDQQGHRAATSEDPLSRSPHARAWNMSFPARDASFPYQRGERDPRDTPWPSYPGRSGPGDPPAMGGHSVDPAPGVQHSAAERSFQYYGPADQYPPDVVPHVGTSRHDLLSLPGQEFGGGHLDHYPATRPVRQLQQQRQGQQLQLQLQQQQHQQQQQQQQQQYHQQYQQQYQQPPQPHQQSPPQPHRQQPIRPHNQPQPQLQSQPQIQTSPPEPPPQMNVPRHISSASRLQQQMLLLQQEQEMLLSRSTSRRVTPSQAPQISSEAQSEDLSRVESQASARTRLLQARPTRAEQEKQVPSATSYPLAEQFLQQGVHGQQGPFAKQQVQPAAPRPQNARQLSPKHSAPVQHPHDELCSASAPQRSASPRSLSTAAPAYPRARELEQQRRLIKERQELQAARGGRTPPPISLGLAAGARAQHRKGESPVRDVVRNASRSDSPKQISPSAKQHRAEIPSSKRDGVAQSSHRPVSAGLSRGAGSASGQRIASRSPPEMPVFVEPIARLAVQTSRSQTLHFSNSSNSKFGPKEARRGGERSASPFGVQRPRSPRSPKPSPRSEKSAPGPRQTGAKPVTSRGSSPRNPASRQVNGQVQPKAKTDESRCKVESRFQSPSVQPRDPSPAFERLPRKPAVPVAPRSQTPPKKGLASYLPGAQPAKNTSSSTPAGQAGFADKVAALPQPTDQQACSQRGMSKTAEEKEGRVYVGFRDGQGQKSGYGVMQMDGTTYTGQWCGSKREGYGTLFFNGGVFEGQWLQGSAHGKGAIHFQNGDTFEGMYANNKKCGHGVYTRADGTKESGEYAGGQKDGLHLWCSGKESWEVVYDMGTVVATRRLDASKVESQGMKQDEATDATESTPAAAAAAAAAAAEAEASAAQGQTQMPRVLDKARPAPRPTPPPSPPAKALLPSNRCRSDSAFRAQGFTDEEIALIERRSPPSSPVAPAPDRAAQPGGCSARVYFPTSARGKSRDQSRGALPGSSAPEAATAADAAAGAAAPAQPQAAAALSEDSAAQQMQEIENGPDETPESRTSHLREPTPEGPENDSAR
ncbi:ARC3 [Symbiodinium sp. CCMP2456]|nr:ARC3 [Symbiodinium sp. CCMP2456]